MSSLDTQIWKLRFDWAKSPAAARVLCLAIARRSFASGRCYASQSKMSELTDLSAKTVKRQLDELAEHGWVGREPTFRGDGSRSVDAIWLTLPEVTLAATAITKEATEEAAAAMDSMTHGGDTVTAALGGGGAQRGEGPGAQEGQKPVPTVSPAFLRPESRPLGRPESDSHAQARAAPDAVEDINSAVELIWAKASRQGRERSSKADIRKGLLSARARGHQMETILRGLAGYFDSHDATKDEGAFQRGAHAILASDRFLSFMPERPSEPTTQAERQARAMIGEGDAPTRELQALWMDLFTKGMPWNPQRGPEPGRLGCRIEDDLQRAYGVEPFALAAVESDDAGAFD